jgi:hypothetical protein
MQKGAMPSPLPTWDHVPEESLRQWLRGLSEEDQIRMKDLSLDLLDRARGDSLMSQFMAIPEPEIPFPEGFFDDSRFTEQERCDWHNNVRTPEMNRRIEARKAAGRPPLETTD